MDLCMCITRAPPTHPPVLDTGGWVIMDKDDPTKIVAKSLTHLFVPTMDYEIGMGTGPYPVNRNRTIFTTSLVPQEEPDRFLVYYGAADANVAYAIIQVSH